MYNPNFIYYEDLSPWVWRVAIRTDLKDIVDMCEEHFKLEMDKIFTPDRPYYTWQIDQAITNQLHNYAKELLIVARDKKTNKLLAYGWVQRGQHPPYSQDELAEARMAHVDLTQTSRTRIKLLAQMLQHWVRWCQICEIPVLVSTTIRREQDAFLRLHEQIGFTLRGSIAYLRLAAPINDEE
jgi:hypothetical protein